ncbi:MAG: DUF2752 domain-containing protein [Kiritimatiellae bacterium]|nr:DUF2752 domain-containing protein [Kiritimatiellia bacterium]
MPPRLSPSAAQIILCVAATGILAMAAHFFGLTLCPLKRLTGIPCPSCGTTRACLLLLGGHPRAAFAMQPFALVAIPLLLLVAFVPRARALGALFLSLPPDGWPSASLLPKPRSWALTRRNARTILMNQTNQKDEP